MNNIKNNKGVSLVSLAITIIVIIIIAVITINVSTQSVDESLEAKFKNDLTSVVTALEIYHQRAEIRGVSTYENDELTWDGKSFYAENTAKIADKTHTQEDSIQYILDGNPVPTTLEGIMTIENGRVKINKEAKPQIDWATEIYAYMGE